MIFRANYKTQKTNCCFQCPDRRTRCHVDCAKYAAYKAETDRNREIRQAFHREQDMMDEVQAWKKRK